MVSFYNVGFRYKHRKILFEDLNLALAPGHIYGLLGRNGEGKSTLLRHIAGLLYPDRGEISVLGYDPSERRPEFLQEVFYIPEEPYLPTGTAKSLAEKYGLLYPKFDQHGFDEAISYFNVSGKERLDRLSYGQRKKVFIAFALATNTRVLLMDEPTNGLDIPSKMQFRKLVLSAFSQDRIIIIATHQVRDLENLIDSIVVLNDNKIALNASMDEISRLLSVRTYTEYNDEDGILYSQGSVNGYKVVTKNSFASDSPMDLEYLFNAIIKSPSEIREIFG